MNERYVQFGCGWCAPDTWLNFDASPTLRMERIPLFGRFIKKNEKPFPAIVRYGDIVKGLPVESDSCTGCYGSHVLEHLALEEFRKALRNVYAMLKKGGVFRLVVPDLRFLVEQYARENSPNAAPGFMLDSGLGQTERNRGLRGFAIEWLGGGRHRWMWDYPSMEAELVSAGFKSIRRAMCGDAKDVAFLAVEEPYRWENCLGVECLK